MKTHILYSITFFWKSHRLWDNVEKYSAHRGGTYDVTIWRIRLACSIRKAICAYAHPHAHMPRYPLHARTLRPICNTVFPQQQWFYECASVLRYTYVACLAQYDAQAASWSYRKCPFYRVHKQDSHHRIFRLTQAFCVIKPPCSRDGIEGTLYKASIYRIFFFVNDVALVETCACARTRFVLLV